MVYAKETLSQDDQERIAKFLNEHPTLSKGVGNEEQMCSVAAINLALTGELTDDRPSCMSPVIHKWVITIQDAMPDSIRNSETWRNLLPLAAGSNNGHDAERLQYLLNWLWKSVLPTLQSIADKYGFGTEWAAIKDEKTADAAAYAAADAADAAAYAAAYAARAAYAADAAAYAAADAARAAAAAYAARAADAADAAAAAYAAARATAAAARAAAAADAAADAVWKTVNPAETLRVLIAIGEQ